MSRPNVRRAILAAAIAMPSTAVALPAPAAAADVASISCTTPAAGDAPADTGLQSFVAITPERIVDTRNGDGGVDEPVGAGCSLVIDLSATTVPGDAEAVALSVTAIAPTTGYLTVYPCAGGLLPTSNLNMRAGLPTPNLAVAQPDDTGRICVYASVETEVLVDVTGWWAVDTTTGYVPVEPDRVADTRVDPGNRVPAGGVFVVELAGDVPVGTTAIVANLTVAGPLDGGFATAYPCGTLPPGTSNVNFAVGEARASAILVGIDTERRLCVSTSADAHVVVDLAGYYETEPFGPTPTLSPVPGTRLADSRDGTGGWDTPFTPGTPRRLRPVAGRNDADRATAVVVNVLAVRADQPGYVEVYPCDAADPQTSAVNYTTAGATSNLVTVPLSDAGEICVATSTATDVVVDLFGVLAGPAGALAERLSFGTETWPPYTGAGTDYAVRCGSPHRLQLELLPGTTAQVNGVPVASGTITLSGADGALASVRLARGGTVRQHWFRCVPDDLPRVDVTRVGSTAPGWYPTVLSQPGADHAYAVVLDNRGAPVWYATGSPRLLEIRRRADGLLSAVDQIGPRYGVEPDAGYRLLALTGQLVDTIVTFDEGDVEHPTDHHDIVDLGERRSAVLTYPLLAGEDLSSIGFLADDVIADNVVQELDDAGNLLWSWRASDHFSYDEITYPVRFPPVPGWYEGTEVDPWHINSLAAVGDGSGDYLASARHLDAVFRIDRDTGDVEWILGSFVPSGTDPNPDGAQRLTIVGDPLGGPRRQHDAHLTGDIVTLLDNRTDTGEPARAVAYEIDTGAGTATMLWSITTSSGSSSFGLGSHRTTFDGNTLVSWGNGPTPLFEEFSPDQESLLQFVQEGGGFSYRVTKEPLSSFSAATLRATAGGTLG